MPIWVPILTAVIGAGVAILVFWLNGRRESTKAKREAAKAFRSAFAEAMTQIEEVDAHGLMSKFKVQHDVAIHEFRRHVQSAQQAAFDTAAKNFQACRSTVQPAALEAMRSIVTGEAIDESDTFRMKEALNELLAFAKA